MYNFFTDSPSASKRRTVYGHMAEQGLISAAQTRTPRYAAPVFDAKRHAALRLGCWASGAGPAAWPEGQLRAMAC